MQGGILEKMDPLAFSFFIEGMGYPPFFLLLLPTRSQPALARAFHSVDGECER
jgi:hypothetical protein